VGPKRPLTPRLVVGFQTPLRGITQTTHVLLGRVIDAAAG
jgi:hypothetical protein